MTLQQNRVWPKTLLFEVGFYNYFWQTTSLCPIPIRGALPGSDRLLLNICIVQCLRVQPGVSEYLTAVKRLSIKNMKKLKINYVLIVYFRHLPDSVYSVDWWYNHGRGKIKPYIICWNCVIITDIKPKMLILSNFICVFINRSTICILVFHNKKTYLAVFNIINNCKSIFNWEQIDSIL